MASKNFGKPPEPLNREDRAHRGKNWQFSRHGIPDMVFNDNGSQFVCREFKARENGNFNIPRRLLCISSQMEKSKRAGY